MIPGRHLRCLRDTEYSQSRLQAAYDTERTGL